MLKTRTWQGRAEVLEVHDGDTFKALIDLGFNITVRTNVRVAGANAAELPTPPGIQARTYLAALLPAGSIVTLDSKRLDKYGRCEAVVQLPDGRDLKQLLLSSGLAVPADSNGNI
jgi:endonuclease YncB( thermonuclease family)